MVPAFCLVEPKFPFPKQVNDVLPIRAWCCGDKHSGIHPPRLDAFREDLPLPRLAVLNPLLRHHDGHTVNGLRDLSDDSLLEPLPFRRSLPPHAGAVDAKPLHLLLAFRLLPSVCKLLRLLRRQPVQGAKESTHQIPFVRRFPNLLVRRHHAIEHFANRVVELHPLEILVAEPLVDLDQPTREGLEGAVQFQRRSLPFHHPLLDGAGEALMHRRGDDPVLPHAQPSLDRLPVLNYVRTRAGLRRVELELLQPEVPTLVQHGRAVRRLRKADHHPV